MKYREAWDDLEKTGRTPRGVRGLKYLLTSFQPGTIICRTPRGVRGLKSLCSCFLLLFPASHPSRGAWIEMPSYTRNRIINRVAPLAGCVD